MWTAITREISPALADCQLSFVAREVTAADIAAAFVHLAKARTSSGAVITVDGGNVAAMMR